MKPLSHEELKVSGDSIQKAAQFISSRMDEAKRLIEELPSKNMFAPSEDAFINVKFATAEELQTVIIQAFLGRLVVHTEAVTIDHRPKVEATALMMTSDGMIPMARSLAGVQASDEFILGQKAFLTAETRAIRKVLNHLGLLPDDEGEDPVMAKVKNTPHKKVEDDVHLEPHRDPDIYDVEEAEGDSIEPEPEVETAPVKSNKRTKRAVPKKKPAASKQVEEADSSEPIPEKALDIKIPQSDSDWPDVTSASYFDTLSKGVEKAYKERKAKQSDYSLERFIRGVLGKDAQANCKRLSLKRLRIPEFEKLYAYYVHGCRPEKGSK